MSRKDDANRRAFYRWEFVRRNKEYQKAYNNLTKNKVDLVDFASISGKKGIDFIKNFFVYPINPKFTYDQVIDEFRKMVRLKQDCGRKANNIYRKYLGKNWGQINREIFKYESKVLKHEVKIDVKKYIPARNKARKEIERLCRIQNMEQIREKSSYLLRVLHQMSSVKLSPEEINIYSSHTQTTVINSYLADNQNIEVFGYEFGFSNISLVDSNVTDFDSSPLIDKFDGDLTRVCFEVDLSYPTNDIIADLKKEISTWKTVRRKYNRQQKGRQNLYFEGVKKILEIFDLRGEGLTYREIAGTSSPDAIQRARNMYNKAKGYIDGGYKQIR